MPKYGNIIFIIFLAALIPVLIGPLAVEQCRGGGCLLCGGVCVYVGGWWHLSAQFFRLESRLMGHLFPLVSFQKVFLRKGQILKTICFTACHFPLEDQ